MKNRIKLAREVFLQASLQHEILLHTSRGWELGIYFLLWQVSVLRRVIQNDRIIQMVVYTMTLVEKSECITLYKSSLHHANTSRMSYWNGIRYGSKVHDVSAGWELTWMPSKLRLLYPSKTPAWSQEVASLHLVPMKVLIISKGQDSTQSVVFLMNSCKNLARAVTLKTSSYVWHIQLLETLKPTMWFGFSFIYIPHGRWLHFVTRLLETGRRIIAGNRNTTSVVQQKHDGFVCLDAKKLFAV